MRWSRIWVVVVGATVWPGAGALGQQQQQQRPVAPAGANGRQQQQAVAAPAPLHDPYATITPRTGGSLLQRELAARAPGQASLDQVSFFSVPKPEPKTIKKHDLVTIIVREESEFTSEGTTETTKDAALQATVTDLIKLNLAKLQINPGGIGDEPLRVNGSASRTFNGEGTVDRSDSLITRITAEVLDVKPNGTLVLQARKRIRTDEEEKELILTGVCRVEDISADNSVMSSQLHDQDIRMDHTGAVRDSTKRGWVPRLLDMMNPF